MKQLNQDEFLKELNSYGYNFKTFNDVKTIYRDDKILIPVLLKYLDEVEDIDDKEYLVRVLTKESYFEVTERLLQEFFLSNNYFYKWAIGNALYIIEDERFIDEYIDIIKDCSHGTARQMLVLLLGKLRNERAKDALIKILHEDGVTPHAIGSLGKYKDKSLIPLLEYFLDEENKKQWIARRKRLKQENPDNMKHAYVEPKAAWKFIEKEARKAIKKLARET